MNADLFLGQIEAGSPGSCWTWAGFVDQEGYGRYASQRVHRLAYEYFEGPIPRGLSIDHACHNEDSLCPGGAACLHRRCVTPGHLVARTPEGNTSAARNRSDRCRNGHLFPEDVYIRPDDGYRKCRECNREAAARYRQRRQVAA
jgi:HNH endonuclease